MSGLHIGLHVFQYILNAIQHGSLSLLIIIRTGMKECFSALIDSNWSSLYTQYLEECYWHVGKALGIFPILVISHSVLPHEGGFPQ